MSLSDLLAHVSPDSPEAALARHVDFERLPKHVAIIMDGNGRWAAQRHLPRVEGHRAGIESVRDSVESSARLGVGVLTLYAFSVENWKRPETEVVALMGLLRHYLRSELKTLLKNNIRFKVIGQPDRAALDSWELGATVPRRSRWTIADGGRRPRVPGDERRADFDQPLVTRPAEAGGSPSRGG